MFSDGNCYASDSVCCSNSNVQCQVGKRCNVCPNGNTCVAGSSSTGCESTGGGDLPHEPGQSTSTSSTSTKTQGQSPGPTGELSDILGYVHFGDSYASGMGAGTTSSDKCRIGSNNYGDQIHTFLNDPDMV